MKKVMVLMAAMTFFGCSSDKYVPVVEEASPKTVMIAVQSSYQNRDALVSGAGVFVSPTGHVLSCAHLLWVGETKSVTVYLLDGTAHTAEILHREDKLDLVLFKINKSVTPYVVIEDPRRLKVGQEVLAIGNPLGFEWSATHGIISSLHVDSVGIYNSTQSDTWLAPGNSGGPLFSMDGRLVGINSRIVPTINAPVFAGLGFSVQCGQIREFLTRFTRKFKGLEAVAL